MKISLTILILLFFIPVAYSQEKFEREYRIKQSEVPLKALDFVNGSFDNVGMKWYGEDNLNGKAIEAKGTKDGKLYSVKFDTIGVLQDVEVVADYKSLSESTKTAITKSLATHFSKFRIQKIQMQWIGDRADLTALIKGENAHGKYATNYEITLNGTIGKLNEYYEVLLTENGELIRKSKIVQRNYHHLIY